MTPTCWRKLQFCSYVEAAHHVAVPQHHQHTRLKQQQEVVKHLVVCVCVGGGGQWGLFRVDGVCVGKSVCL